MSLSDLPAGSKLNIVKFLRSTVKLNDEDEPLFRDLPAELIKQVIEKRTNQSANEEMQADSNQALADFKAWSKANPRIPGELNPWEDPGATASKYGNSLSATRYVVNIST